MYNLLRGPVNPRSVNECSNINYINYKVRFLYKPNISIISIKMLVVGFDSVQVPTKFKRCPF